MENEDQFTDDVNEETTSQETNEEQTSSDKDAIIAKLEAEKKQLYARLKKEKGGKDEDKPSKATQVDDSYKEELRLLAQGYSEDDIAVLKRVSGEGTLVEALKDPLFEAYKVKQEADKRSRASQMSPSRVVGGIEVEKPINEMTKDEHRELVEKMRKK